MPELLSCEFCEILKNTFFTEHFRTTASVGDFDIDKTKEDCSGIDQVIYKINYVTRLISQT